MIKNLIFIALVMFMVFSQAQDQHSIDEKSLDCRNDLDEEKALSDYLDYISRINGINKHSLNSMREILKGFIDYRRASIEAENGNGKAREEAERKKKEEAERKKKEEAERKNKEEEEAKAKKGSSFEKEQRELKSKEDAESQTYQDKLKEYYQVKSQMKQKEKNLWKARGADYTIQSELNILRAQESSLRSEIFTTALRFSREKGDLYTKLAEYEILESYEQAAAKIQQAMKPIKAPEKDRMTMQNGVVVFRVYEKISGEAERRRLRQEFTASDFTPTGFTFHPIPTLK